MFVTQNPDYVSMQDLAVLLRRWHEKKYGASPASLRVVETLLKTNEEVGELNEAFRVWVEAPTNHPRIAELERAVGEEAADVVMVLFHLCRKMGMALENAILKKLQVIFDRLHEPFMLTPPSIGSRSGLPGGESALSPTWFDPTKVTVVNTEEDVNSTPAADFIRDEE